MGHFIDNTIHDQEVDKLKRFLNSRELTNQEAMDLLGFVARNISAVVVIETMTEHLKHKGVLKG